MIKFLESNSIFPDIGKVQVSLLPIDRCWGDMHERESLEFLCKLAALDFSPILEFGTFRGRTTCNLAINLPVNRKVVTVDWGKGDSSKENMGNDTYPSYLPGELFEYANGSKYKIEQIIGDSTKLDLSRFEKTMGMILIDGGHSYEVCMSDSRKAFNLVKSGGVIIWDDYSPYWHGVRRAINELAEERTLYYLQKEQFVIYMEK